MRRLTACLSAVVLAAAAAATPVAAATHYTSFWAFGDSLSDDGNLFALTGGLIPAPPYFDGRRSNGPVWAEHIAEDFAAKGLPNDNFAYVFGDAVTNDDTLLGLPLQVPDFDLQIELFKAGSSGSLGQRPLGAVWLGANDVLQQIQLNPDPTAVIAASVAAANAVADGLDALAAEGLKDLVVFNLPALNETPQFTLPNLTHAAAPLAFLGTQNFNETLDSRLASLGSGLNVTKIDIFAAFNDLIADPGSIGLSDAVNPCYFPTTNQLCTPAEEAERVFYDPVHPSAPVHAAIADIVREHVAPVPLPVPAALLVAALAGLGAASRGRRRVGD